MAVYPAAVVLTPIFLGSIAVGLKRTLRGQGWKSRRAGIWLLCNVITVVVVAILAVANGLYHIFVTHPDLVLYMQAHPEATNLYEAVVDTYLHDTVAAWLPVGLGVVALIVWRHLPLIPRQVA
jgi:hypothetical protein